MNTYSVSELVSALSYALDLTEGMPLGHSLRCCVIGMRIADAIGLSTREKADLYYALLLKDTGCSSNASRMWHMLGSNEIDAKQLTKYEDWTRFSLSQVRYVLKHAHADRPFVERFRGLWHLTRNTESNALELIRIRCERGASIARRMGLSDSTAQAIHSLDEHWDGLGYPNHLKKHDIPVLSRILNIAQNLEVFHEKYGAETAMRMVRDRNGRWFAPDLVRAVEALHREGTLWQQLDASDMLSVVMAMEPEHVTLEATQTNIDKICVAFADVIDAKSPYTLCHSTGVTQVADAMAEYFGMTGIERGTLRRAALLHDIGKLGVPNSILEKNGKLTPEEWAYIVKHPFYTHEILSRVSGFAEITEIAASHHEKLDGSGYYRGLKAEDLSLSSRILAVADIYDALAATRPYRDAMPTEKVLGIIHADAPHKLDAECAAALASCVDRGLPGVEASSYLQSMHNGAPPSNALLREMLGA